MKTIKKLIIATILISSLSPLISVCARENDSDDETENAAAAQVAAIAATPQQVAEETRIKKFVAKKAPHIAPFLPRELVVIVLDYVKPTEEQVAEANKKLFEAANETPDHLKHYSKLSKKKQKTHIKSLPMNLLKTD